jgi:hypothetical protein
MLAFFHFFKQIYCKWSKYLTNQRYGNRYTKIVVCIDTLSEQATLNAQ